MLNIPLLISFYFPIIITNIYIIRINLLRIAIVDYYSGTTRCLTSGLAGRRKLQMIDDKTLQIVIALAAVIVTAIRLFGRNKEKSPLSTDEFRPFPLQKIEVLSHDSKRYTFALPTETTKLGLPIGQHISFRFTDSENKTHQRSYTPVTGNETLGKVSFCIKTYRAGVHPKFPDGGKMSQHLDSLSVGDTVDMKGPKGHLDYLGKGKFSVKKMRKPLQFRRAKHFGLLSGGTGITPMLQVISAVLKGDKGITLSLIYANQSKFFLS